jgi:hypothetical protein
MEPTRNSRPLLRGFPALFPITYWLAGGSSISDTTCKTERLVFSFPAVSLEWEYKLVGLALGESLSPERKDGSYSPAEGNNTTLAVLGL